jgi:hypothetical protein
MPKLTTQFREEFGISFHEEIKAFLGYWVGLSYCDKYRLQSSYYQELRNVRG